jgi:hypothetical protein
MGKGISPARVPVFLISQSSAPPLMDGAPTDSGEALNELGSARWRRRGNFRGQVVDG